MYQNKLTVFTPTYNRAYSLPQLYKSLCRQTCQDFVWLVIDDGSTDDTAQLVQSWIEEGKIEIQYIFQENQGMHGAHNTAYQNIKTELNVCIDSDDFMPDDAVELILQTWKEKQNKDLAGLVGLDVDKSGKTIGTEFLQENQPTTLSEFYHKGGRGDKKLVLRTEVIKQYPPYPIFEGERFVPLGTLYLMIDQDYNLLPINKHLCVVEYMEDGSTRNIFKQYKRHPKGFRYSRDIELSYKLPVKEKIKKVLHRISSTLFIGDKAFFKGNPAKAWTLFLLPVGVIFHWYIKNKTKP